jgi:hypothetical protein
MLTGGPLIADVTVNAAAECRRLTRSIRLSLNGSRSEVD